MIWLSDYLKQTYGEKLYKISLDGGFTCPNRDGKLDTRGCIFCSGSGSGDFAANRNLTITEQIEEGKLLVAQKYTGGKYIAYFQAFTNTYAPVEYLKKVFTEAVEHPDIAVLSIATRPDCLPREVLELLRELNAIKPVWVELGLQTIHKETAEYIRRGYELQVYDEAVRDLKEIGIAQVIVHVILGLPGESKDMMLQTVSYVSDSGADGIKLQLLHILKGTDLEKEYAAGRVPVMTMEEYVLLVREALRILRTDMVVHRVTGDGAKKCLIAPLWSGNKKAVLNAIKKD